MRNSKSSLYEFINIMMVYKIYLHTYVLYFAYGYERLGCNEVGFIFLV